MFKSCFRLLICTAAITAVLGSVYSPDPSQRSAHACLCGTIDIYEVLTSNNQAIFIGIVSQVEVSGRDRIAHVDVIEVWKPDDLKEGSVLINTGISDCAYGLLEDETYLIHAEILEQETGAVANSGLYHTSKCSMTSEMNQGESNEALIQLIDFATNKEQHWQSDPFSVSYVLGGENYTLTGRTTDNLNVNEMEIYPTRGVTLSLTQSDQSGMLEIVVPKAVMDGIVGHAEMSVRERTDSHPLVGLNSNSTHTTVMAQLPEGVHTVQVRGLYVVPEFGGLAVMVMVVTIAGLIICARGTLRNRLFGDV